ncbi:HD domain-containing protein [Phytoactinopolyspora sp. XMNu-373]|uniref:HD domain-containing protein n=1 Tax=Phytoactinopolyspora mesophila TaxID=2650750 RepID=A0A7K3MDP3_9ACTN|nr:HD domain-containing protein [Phytoactinopolyspora mesophila]
MPTSTDAVLATLGAASWPPPDRRQARRASALALAAYDGHTRDQGTPYLAHPLAVVTILRTELHVTTPHTLVLGLLHDALEVTPGIADRIRTALGDDLVEQLRGMIPDHRLKQRAKCPGDEAAWRAKTLRLDDESLLVRLADRIHNLRDLQNSPDVRRRERFLAALADFYLPLAHDARSRTAHLNAAHTVLVSAYESCLARAEEEGPT